MRCRKLFKWKEGKNEIIKYLLKENKILKYHASFDNMTKALNRRMGIKLLEKRIQQSENHNKNLIVCFIDIDKLKKINDNFGHIEGDKTLMKVSRIIRTYIRKEDLFIRIGGDEFLLVFSGISLKSAKNILIRICDNIKRFNRSKVKEYEIKISYGFAQIRGNKINVNNLIRVADKEMYKKKISKCKGNCKYMSN